MTLDAGGDFSEQPSDSVPEYDEILARVASSPRNYPVPRRVSRKHLEQAFLTSFELIGGVPRLALWADRNPAQFYSLLSKLFPQQVEAKLGADASLASILKGMGATPATFEHPPQEISEAETVSVSARPRVGATIIQGENHASR